MMHRFLIATLAVWWMLPAGEACAFDKKVEAAFRGQILFSDSPFASQTDDKSTIAAIQKQKREIIQCPSEGGVGTATLHLTAFATSATTATSLGFSIVDVANPTKKGHANSKVMVGLQPGLTVVETDLQMTTDDIVGAKFNVTLLQGPGKTALASGDIELPCLAKPEPTAKVKVLPGEKVPAKKK